MLKNSFILIIVVSILIIIVDTCHYDIIEVSPVITSLVAGVIFAIAVIYSGTLIDIRKVKRYREICRLLSWDCTRIPS